MPTPPYHNGIVFSIPRKTLIGFVQGREVVLFTGMDSVCPYDSIPYELGTFFHRNKLTAVHPGKTFPWYRVIHSPGMDGIYAVYGEKKILILFRMEEKALYGLPPLRADILVLCNNPRINIPLIIKHLDVSIIVADGSNYTSTLKRIEQECEEPGMPFHSTPSMGYYRD